ncbi:inactive serine protease 54 [Antechinus flavipes]|uniref:inactive serine protease 54 n=1 Tax=Antechinus flavipes TaxID=38775 RepID=UPI0022367A06|nr:inactive serine protease 54 [Antechinus flavipes]
MAARRRPFFLLLCISHSLTGCLIEGGFISAFLPNDGEDLATVDMFPWVVSLQDSQYTPLTLGCILNEFWILSIASRFQNRKTVLALVGITDMNARRRTQPEYLITVILRHEGFNSMTMENNIALLKTYTAIEFNDQVQPICFTNRNLAPGILENCWVSGWIHTAANRKRMKMGVLRKLPVEEVWPCSLKRPWGTACYSAKEENNIFGCLGDPGNPVMCQAKETSLWVLSGILSSGGVSCGGPFLCTKLSYYGDWISKRIMNEGANFCPVFSWEELPSTASPAARAQLQNVTPGALPQAFSLPPPPRKKSHSKKHKKHGRLKLKPLKMAPAREEDSGSAEAESPQDQLQRAALMDSSEPVYYDYYSGEVMPIAGRAGPGQAGAVTSALCTLTLLFGRI